jgi:hypothetical protein
MWNWYPWQNEADYGRKYDWGFYEISGTEMARFHKHNTIVPTYGWVATELHSNVGDKRYMGALPERTTVVDSMSWEQAGVKLGGMGLKRRLVLTRGVRAAAWALEQLSQGQQLVLVGFDNLRVGRGLPAEEGFPEAYRVFPGAFPISRYKGGMVKEGNHDFSVEGPLLHSLAVQAGVELVHAQDVWL